MKLKVKRLHKDAVVPTFALPNDSGMDMFSYGEHIILPGELKKIPTGVAIQLPHGYAGLIWDKSSVGSKSLKVFCGVFDEDYRGEYFMVIKNLSDSPHTFVHGQKIAQMLIQKIEHPEIIEVDELDETVRGEGGFGSTGK
jgi:dUTP pyrophosphatase